MAHAELCRHMAVVGEVACALANPVLRRHFYLATKSTVNLAAPPGLQSFQQLRPCSMFLCTSCMIGAMHWLGCCLLVLSKTCLQAVLSQVPAVLTYRHPSTPADSQRRPVLLSCRV